MFVVWMSLITRGKSKQTCRVGLMSAGSRGEYSGEIKRKKLVTAEVPESAVHCTVFYCRCM